MSLKWLPLLLLILIPVVLLIVKKRIPPKLPIKPLAETKSLQYLPSLKKVIRKNRLLKIVEHTLLALIIILVVLIIARPQRQILKLDESKTRDIVLCMDTSGSMRPYISKSLNAMKDIINSNPTDRYSIVGFGSAAFTIVPLTRDTVTLNERIDYWKTVYEGDGFVQGAEAWLGYEENGGGTDISDGIIGCMKRFGNLDSEKSRNIIMLSDLEHTDNNLDRLYEVSKLVPKYKINFFVASPPKSYETVQYTETVQLTDAKVSDLDSEESTEEVINEVFKQIQNKEVNKEYLLADYPQYAWGALIIVSALWSLTLWLRWRDEK